MTFIYILFNFNFIYSGEFHLGYTKSEIQGLSWYHIIHWENIREAQNKHRLSKYFSIV